MCGRYSLSLDPDDLVRDFDIERVDVRERLEPSYNVAPTDEVYAIVSRYPGGDKEATPQRRLTRLRWGLVPYWSKDVKIASRLINARIETAHEKPAFRRAFTLRRCLLPADGYYEWYKTKSGTKQPFFIRPKGDVPLAMAGLYEIWRDPAREEDDPDRFRWTSTILTTRAEDSIGQIHDRMPFLIEPDNYAAWLDPGTGDVDTLRSLLVPAAPGRLAAYPVSTAVNKVANNGPELTRPITPEADEAELTLWSEE